MEQELEQRLRAISKAIGQVWLLVLALLVAFVVFAALLAAGTVEITVTSGGL